MTSTGRLIAVCMLPKDLVKLYIYILPSPTYFRGASVGLRLSPTHHCICIEYYTCNLQFAGLYSHSFRWGASCSWSVHSDPSPASGEEARTVGAMAAGTVFRQGIYRSTKLLLQRRVAASYWGEGAMWVWIEYIGTSGDVMCLLML